MPWPSDPTTHAFSLCPRPRPRCTPTHTQHTLPLLGGECGASNHRHGACMHSPITRRQRHQHPLVADVHTPTQPTSMCASRPSCHMRHAARGKSCTATASSACHRSPVPIRRHCPLVPLRTSIPQYGYTSSSSRSGSGSGSRCRCRCSASTSKQCHHLVLALALSRLSTSSHHYPSFCKDPPLRYQNKLQRPASVLLPLLLLRTYTYLPCAPPTLGRAFHLIPLAAAPPDPSLLPLLLRPTSRACPGPFVSSPTPPA